MKEGLKLTTTIKSGERVWLRMASAINGNPTADVTAHFVGCTRKLEAFFQDVAERIWQGTCARQLLGGLVPRPEALVFAQLMERELRENEHKGGWAAMTPAQILRMVWGDVNKLDSALERCDLAKVQEQCADVANGCMMLLDVLGLLLPPAAPAPAPAEATEDADA